MKKIIYTFIIFFVILININNIEASSKEVTYFFDDEISDFDIYYDYNDNFPFIEGYEFSHKEENSNQINLYYITKYYDIYIEGNGGTYLDEEVVYVGKVKHGDSYTHRATDFNKYNFVKDNYEFIGLDRDFDTFIESVCNDVVYKARYISNKIYYTFILNEEEIIIEQYLSNKINVPTFITHNDFINFYTKSNEELDINNYVDNSSNIVYKAYFKEDIKLIDSTNNSLEFINLEGVEYKLKNDNYNSNWQLSGLFNNLDVNSEYSLYIRHKNLNEVFVGSFNTDEFNFKLEITDNKITFININQTVYIKENDNYTEGDIDGINIHFNLLNPTTTYEFRIGDKTYTFKTKQSFNKEIEHYIFKINNNYYLLLNNDYTYFINDVELNPNSSFTLLNNDIKFYVNETIESSKSNLLNLIETKLITIEESFPLHYTQTNDTLQINNKNLDEIIFVNNKEFIFDEYLFTNLDFNKTYFIITKKDDTYYINDYKMSLPLVNLDSIKLEVYSDRVIIKNNSSFLIKLLDQSSKDLEITFKDLNPNTKYNLVITISGVDYFQTFYTNEVSYDIDLELLDLEVGSSRVVINSPITNYSYSLLKEGVSTSNKRFNYIIDGKVEFNFLEPNTTYTLYARDLVNNRDILITTINTIKVKKENVIKPTPYITPISKITDNSVEISIINELLEYSYDLINWFDYNMNKISRLESYTEYTLYVRYKETLTNEHSNYVIVNKFKTLAKAPNEDSFFNLYFDYQSISFDLLEGYKYYYGEELIESSSFTLNNLEHNSNHTFKVYRNSDDKLFILNIKLKSLEELNELDKEVNINKDNKTLEILNSKLDITYVLIYNEEVLESIKGNGETISFNVTSELTYVIRLTKTNTNEVYYKEYYIKDIYIPYSVKDKVNIYINTNNIKLNNEISSLINKAISEENNVNSKEELDIIYNLLIESISKLENNKNNVIIISSIIVTLIILTPLMFFIIKRKGTKKR